MPKANTNNEKWFWERVDKENWKWIGTVGPQGYGVINSKSGQIKAHRFAYVLLKGPLNKSEDVVQSCGDRLCLLPDHLVKQTRKDRIWKWLKNKDTYFKQVLELARNPIVTKECIRFEGSLDGCGYGRLGIDGKLKGAHVLVWELTNGKVPNGFEVCHSCDHPWCIQIQHLFLATHQQNIQDMIEKGRHWLQKNPTQAIKGERHGRSKLNQSQVEWLRQIYEGGEYTQSELAAMLRITKEHAGRLLRKESWGHI